MNWAQTTLGGVLSLEYGRSLPRHIREESGAVPVAGSNGEDGRHNVALINGPGIVVGRKGSAGKVTWFGGDFWPIDTTYYVRADKRVADLRWLFYLLNFNRLERLNKTTGVPGLNRNDVYAEKCMLPPISEQQRIVEILDEVHRVRNLRRAADAKAARILPALFLNMFGDPATNPKGLKKEPLGKLIKVKSGDFLPAKDMVENGTSPVYGGNGVNGFHDKYMFEERKVVLGRVGAYCGAVHYSEPRAWITDNALYVSEKFDDLDDRYLVAALEQANLNQYAGRAGQPLISGSRIYPVEILVPLETEQRVFAKSVAALGEMEQQHDKAGKNLERLWGQLMQQAFSGQLTAKWRAAHMKNLLVEIEEQARLLNLQSMRELETIR